LNSQEAELTLSYEIRKRKFRASHRARAATPQMARHRHKKLNEILLTLAGPLLGAIPGGFMLWMVTGPIFHSNKLDVATVMVVVFIAAGILWGGVLLCSIMAYLTLIYQRLLARDNHLSFGSTPPPASTRTES
jgi:hypothetical protein